MVKTCCVKNCDIAPEGNVTCFRFPNNRLLKRKWIDAIGLSNKLTATSTVCIRHFQQDDYEIVRGRPRLKPKVIPSVFCDQDKRSRSPCITEDDLISQEINTHVTLSSLQKENSNLAECNTGRENVVRTELRDSTEGSTTIQKERVTVLGNEEKIELQVSREAHAEAGHRQPELREDRTVLAEDGMECNNEDRTESSREVSSEQVDDRTDLDNKHNTESNNESVKEESERTVELDRNEVQDEGSGVPQPGTEGAQNKNENVEVQNGKKSKPNGVIVKEKKHEKGYQDSFIESTRRPSGADEHKDIEDIIVNYQIKQTRPLHAADTPPLPPPEHEAAGGEQPAPPESDPVFIELAVQGDRAGSPRDCLMVLESVQVELDPSTFLDGEPDDCTETVDLATDDHDDLDHHQAGRPDPISLLTSSDSDEVMIQEPHIDTVEVSDETDEDDLPLVKLLRAPRPPRRPARPAPLAVWDSYEYFCMDCQFTATTRQEYRSHAAAHSTILQVCDVCDYTTASKSQFSRHRRKHREERRFRCHLCDYRARHNMSLIYHLKSHHALSSARKGFRCDKCGFKSDVKAILLKHVKLCSSNVKMYSCDRCVYETKRPSDLRRHRARRHQRDADDDLVP